MKGAKMIRVRGEKIGAAAAWCRENGVYHGRYDGELRVYGLYGNRRRRFLRKFGDDG